ncbi:thioredoxin family protein, partial [Bdellovibrionota bacterium]
CLRNNFFWGLMMEIKIFGSGCTKCQRLYSEVEEALKKTGIDAELIKVEKIEEISKSGVFMTPALMIDGKIKSSGKLPSIEKIEEWIKECGE